MSSSFTPGRNSEPRRIASLGSLLDDQHWHHLAVERHGSHLNLTVDKHTERVVIPAEFSHWDVQQVVKPKTPTLQCELFLCVFTYACLSLGECGLSPECRHSQATGHQNEFQWLPGEPAV